MRPAPCRFITAAACFIVKRTPSRLTPSTRSQSARSTVSRLLASFDREAGHRADAGVREYDVEPALGRDHVVDERLDLILIGDVDHERADGAAALG